MTRKTKWKQANAEIAHRTKVTEDAALKIASFSFADFRELFKDDGSLTEFSFTRYSLGVCEMARNIKETAEIEARKHMLQMMNDGEVEIIREEKRSRHLRAVPDNDLL
ncbi:hypothetical protein GV827_19760 [Sulfitobacter sp. JBTF-M27]|uniref:Uncharacterized protein n=1 Tax=Sulfitobacter sediminilitoris TaxID=2698830 RepID=A0A6P0CGW6_9RHOB|nr:hypothetical protein [Sulfitobacter sediminilitoris]NEK24620.1 hypothetical protein [Sulfitobacter sediminilitoris]